MVEEKKKAAVKKTVVSKVAAEGAVEKKLPAVKKTPAAVWPFPAAEAATEVKKAPAKKPAAKKAASPKTKPAEKQEVAQPSAQERYRMVETAAYYIAERSGFQGCTSEHWSQAELEIAAKLAS